MKPRRPHLVIFNPDQWRGDCLGHVGHPAARTPVLDRLVREAAVSFRNAFCQNPVCTPSRCAFMTGWYPHVRGHRTMFHMLHPERGETFLLPILREAGYHVFWGGKNDLVPGQEPKTPYADAFTDWTGFESDGNYHGGLYEQARGQPGSDSYYSFFIGRLNKREGQAWFRDFNWWNVQQAIRQIQNRPADKPLCLFLPLGFPHPPYAVEEPFFSAIDRTQVPPPIPPPERWDEKPALLGALHRNFNLGGWSLARWRELRAVYLGMCMRMDALLGELITALKETGIYDDTAIFFFSDHGDFTGDYELVEKTQNTFEDCLVRVPLIIKPPKGVPVQPRVSEAMVELTDVTETIYSLLGLNPPYTRFGRSLWPVVAGERDTHREAVFCEGGRLPGERHCMELESHDPDRPFEQHPYWPRLSLQARDDWPFHSKALMCRTRTWKYVLRIGERDELYDLRNDPGERINRIGDPSVGPVVQALREQTLRWLYETADVVPWTTDRR
jgi:arylsulfatase A-like enzyme